MNRVFLDALRTGLGDVPDDSRIVVGVSGGADSVSLLCGLNETRGERSLQLHVAHLDHGLRPGSRTDADWVAALARSLGLAATAEHQDVASLAEDSGVGLEEAGRRARYAFFERVAAEVGARFVAVAHTADDQAETILHHVVRGTGLDGLRGMPRTRSLGPSVQLVRPLLDVSRQAVEAYLSDLGQHFLTDPSNSSEAFTRNRIRHELLPLLERDYNPSVRDALHRLSAQVSDAAELVQQNARELLKRSLVEAADGTTDGKGERVLLDVATLQDASDHVMRAAFVELWRDRGWSRQRMGFTEWQRLVDVARGGDPTQFPGRIDARLVGSHVVLAKPR